MIRHLRYILTLCLLLATSVVSGNGLDRALQLHSLAQGSYLIGDTPGALKVIEECLRITPNYLPALRLRARILIDENRIEHARETLQSALEIASDDAESRLLYALLQIQDGEGPKALLTVEEIKSETTPESREGRIARQLYEILNFNGGEIGEATRAFTENSENESTNRELATDALLFRVERFMSEGKVRDAIDTLDQAIALYQQTSRREDIVKRRRLRFQRANLLIQSKEIDLATQELEQLYRKDRSDLPVVLALSSLYTNESRWSQLEELLPTLAKRPELRDIQLYLEGRIALSRDRVGTARARFESALELARRQKNNLQPTLNFYHAICLDLLGRTNEAETSFLKAIELGFRPETSEEAIELGRALTRLGQHDEAITAMEDTILRGITSEKLWIQLGRYHRKAGNSALAISALNEALQINPNSTTLGLRGSLLRQIGDLEGAVADYNNALVITPDNGALRYEKGLTLLQLGQIEQGEEQLYIASQTLKNQHTLDLLHAATAYTIGKINRALESLNRYIAHVPSINTEWTESATAVYLNDLLHAEHDMFGDSNITKNRSIQLFRNYSQKTASRKDVLDWAGRADTEKQARAQISSAAFWLGQLEKEAGNTRACLELLDISIEFGNSQIPEWNFAKWQKNALPNI